MPLAEGLSAALPFCCGEAVSGADAWLLLAGPESAAVDADAAERTPMTSPFSRTSRWISWPLLTPSWPKAAAISGGIWPAQSAGCISLVSAALRSPQVGFPASQASDSAVKAGHLSAVHTCSSLPKRRLLGRLHSRLRGLGSLCLAGTQGEHRLLVCRVHLQPP